MFQEVYRYHFPTELPMAEVEATLALAFLGAEALHGESQVALETGHAWDADRLRCVIDATTPVGRSVCCLFTGYLRRQFGSQAFTVERLSPPVAAPGSAGAA